jgi:hopanoid biosynthesis associated protein HpnK
VRRLIVTADDFGSALGVNEAVEIAHREGILSAASLMVGGGAVADAVARARRLPTLRVGLHLVVVDGPPVLAPRDIPDLLAADGLLPSALGAAGVRFFFLTRLRRQLEAEVRAQFEAFRATGLPLDHVNAHHHMHLHPTVLGMILKVGRDFGLRAVRLPREPLLASRRAARTGWVGAAAGLGLWPWTGLLRLRLRRAGLRCNDFVFGLGGTGAMHEDTVLRLLRELPEGVTEMYFHPATRGGPEPAYVAPDPDSELAALVSPRVRAALQAMGIRPIGFSEL